MKWLSAAVVKQLFNMLLSVSVLLCHTWAVASNEEKKPRSPTLGIQPVILLENDVQELILNKEVYELMIAFSQDNEKNRFVTESEAEAAVRKQLSDLKDINEDLLETYMTSLNPMILTFSQTMVTQSMLDQLIAEGQIDAANALKSIVNQPINTNKFDAVVENTLIDKLVSSESDSSDSDDSVVADVEKLAKKTSEKFISKVSDIALLAEDTESLIKKIISFAKKVNPIGKDFKALKEDKEKRISEAEKELGVLDTSKTKNDPVSTDRNKTTVLSYEKAKSIIKQEIEKHKKQYLKLKTKGKTEEANKSLFIATELHKIYLQEISRVKNNDIIEKINKAKATLQKAAVAEADKLKAEKEAKQLATEKEEVSGIVSNVKKLVVPQVRYYLDFEANTDAVLTFKKQHPPLDKDIAECVSHLVGIDYVSQYALEHAVMTMLEAMDNLLNSEASTEDQNFTCQVNDKRKAGDYQKSGAAAIVMAKALKPYQTENLTPVDIQALPDCTQCSEPLKGLSYGFYPYWQASAKYQQDGLPTVNPALLDYSVFSHIAYFALAIDADGKFNSDLHLQHKISIDQFFNTLYTYNVKRDVVLYSNQWQSWGAGKSGSDGMNELNSFAINHYQKLTQMHNQYLDYGGISGVTFYFDDYTSKADKTNIINYINLFNTQMQAAVKGGHAPKFDIKLMLGIHGLETEELNIGGRIEQADANYFLSLSELFMVGNDSVEGSFSKQQLTQLASGDVAGLLKDNTAQPVVSSILVPLIENTSRYKKILRLQIEEEFSGGARVKALSSIVPIIGRTELTERGEQSLKQFQDDVAYLKYNFGGIGLWNLPYTGVDENGKPLETNLVMGVYTQLLKLDYGDGLNGYLDRDKLGLVGQLMLSNAVVSKVDVCGVVCPKRKTFVSIFIGTLVVNAILAVLWRTNCKARVVIKATRPIRELLLLSSLLLFFALLGCHPQWQQYGNIILGAFVIVIFTDVGYRLLSSSYEKSDEM